MSTRAIIGIKQANGTIKGAWQWNDGQGMTSILNQNFNTLEKAEELIEEGMWSVIYTKQEASNHENWLKNDLYKGRNEKIPVHSYKELNGMQILRDGHDENRKPCIYSSFKDAKDQDISYIYLFDREKSEWKCFR